MDCVQAALNRCCVAGRSRTLRAAPEVIFPAPDDRPGAGGGPGRPGPRRRPGPAAPGGRAERRRIFAFFCAFCCNLRVGHRVADSWTRTAYGGARRTGWGWASTGGLNLPRRAYGAGSSPLALWPSKDRPPGPAHRPRTACSSP